MKNNFAFFQNAECEYFPCHTVENNSEFNCLFCYCPLYTLGDTCGGDFSFTKKGYKDCSECQIPHLPGGYDYVLSKFDSIAEIEKSNRVERTPKND